ncbi:MAG: hypothetical protein ACREEQ_10325, partial [Caulobacteraceae bacterium]
IVMAAPPPDQGAGEPLPPGAPTDSYQLAAWCYGALDEYLTIYKRVIPDLKDMDRMFGTSVVEAEPYSHDMAAYRVELKMIGQSVSDAEKASPNPISQEGVAAMDQGRNIWSIAETKPRRELARAWMLWALPDKCDSNARELAKRSLLLGKALKYNADAAPAPAPAPALATDDAAKPSPPQSAPPAGAAISTAPQADDADQPAAP